MRRRLLLTASLLLTACASKPTAREALPMLRLPPAVLGATRHALSQRLSVSRLDQPETPPQRIELQLQLDASALLLAGFAYGQRVLLMHWDGHDLRVQRHAMLPAEVDTDRMLRDLCLTFWPAEAVQAALPDGWVWVAASTGHALERGGQTWLAVRRPAANLVEIENRAEGYRLQIESRSMEGE